MDADTQDYLDRGEINGGNYSPSVATAFDALVVGLKADGVWNKISDLGVIAGWGNIAGAFTPIKTSSSIEELVNDGYTDADYIASGPDCGLNDYAQLKFLMSYGGGTPRHLHAGPIDWQTNAGTIMFGQWGGEATVFQNSSSWPRIYCSNGDIGAGAYSFGGADFISLASQRPIGDIALIRESSSSLKLCSNGSVMGSQSGVSSSSPSSGSFELMSGDNPARKLQAYCYAPGITELDYVAILARIQTLLAAFGFSTEQASCIYEGDSLTTDFAGVTPYSTYLSATPGWQGRHVNVARSSETAANCDSQYASQESWVAPDPVFWTKGYAFFGPGINDLSGGETAPTVFASLQSLWAKSKTAGNYVVALNLAPCAFDGWTEGMETQRGLLRAMIAGAEGTDVDKVLDLQTILPDPTDLSLFQPDKLHRTSLANQLTAQLIAASIPAPAPSGNALRTPISMQIIKQNQTAEPLLFMMVLASDGTTPATGLSPTVTLSKNGTAFASPSGAVSEIGSGWYSVAGNATDASALGPLLIHASAATANDSDAQFQVVAYDPRAALATPTNITAGTITTVTNLTNAPAGIALASELAKVPKSGSTFTYTNTGTSATATVSIS